MRTMSMTAKCIGLMLLLLAALLHSSQNIFGMKTKNGRCLREVAILTQLEGSLESPGYPRRYKTSQICVWHVAVRRGFQIKFSFDLSAGYGIEKRGNCLDGDALIISSRRQTFERYTEKKFRSGSHSLILCGTDKFQSTIVSPSNSLWIRFQSDRRRGDHQIGFKARYTAVDINECLKSVKRKGCQHICINTVGSYQCACRLGYILSEDRRSCKDIDECQLGRSYHGCSHRCNNFQGSYHCSCPYGRNLDSSMKKCVGGTDFKVHFTDQQDIYYVTPTAPVGTHVLLVHANAASLQNKTAEKPIRYHLVSQNNRSEALEFRFVIDPSTGLIQTKTLLHSTGASEYSLVIRAALDEWIFNTTTIRIRLKSTDTQRNSTEPLRTFTVLVHQGLLPGHVVFDLKQHYHSKQFPLIFRLQSQNPYFTINRQKGQLLASAAIKNLTSSVSKWRQDVNVIVYRVEKDGSLQVLRCTVIVMFLPTYPGEGYLTREILNIVAKDIANYSKPLFGETFNTGDKKRSKLSVGTVGLHRLFRRPSPRSRAVSKAKLYFDKVIEKVESKVKESFAADDNAGPVFFNLGTGQIVSPGKLSGLVDASKCKEALPSPSCLDQFLSRYRTFDGTCNNIANPRWGAAATAFHRLLAPKYYDVDGISDPIGFPNLPEAPELPTPHEISDLFFIPSSHSEGNKRKYSLMLMQWGQFVDHDLTFTAESEGGHHCVLPRCDGSVEDFTSPCFPIMYPGNVGDCTMFIRSAAICQTTHEKVEPRQQMNTITSYLDGSVVYGSSKEDADRLRKLDGSGELKIQSDDLLPFIDAPLHPPLSFCKDFGGCFDAGDVRVNEQVGLTSLHTLLVREHNRVARELHLYNRNWEETRIFEEARKIVGAFMQHITYHEYLPKVLGKNGLSPYSGYKDNVDPTVSNVFAAAAFRFGHSLVRPAFPQLNQNFDRISEEVPLVNAFFNNTLLLRNGIERFMFGLIGNRSETVDRTLAFGLVKQLFQRPGATHGFNLVALNIQRGRDHGLPTYGAWRKYCGLKPAYSFEETSAEIRDASARSTLRILYNDRVDYADLFVAGLAEDPLADSMVGPTFHCLIKNQFEKLRDGDRYYYESDNVFTTSQLHEIRKVTLARIMCDNVKGMVSVQRDVFKSVVREDRRYSCDYIATPDLETWSENTPISDGAGRGEWSSWVDSVRFASGTWATILRSPVCKEKVVSDVQCQTLGGMPYGNAGENAICDKRFGIYCRDGEQKKKEAKCSHYRFRLRCHIGPVREKKTTEVRTGLPKTKTPPSMNCTKSSRYVKDGGLGVLVYTPRDYAAVFPPRDETTLDKHYLVSPQSEYLLAGKVERQSRKRFLLKFDLRRVKRYDVVHSATLQLYFLGRDDRFTENSLQGFFPRALSIEAYLVTSANWSRHNVTSRIPWHGDFLKIGMDTEAERIAKKTVSTEEPSWLELDVYKAVYRWRISHLQRAQNYGLLIKVEDDDYPDGVYRFASSSHLNESIRPRLRVCMTATAW